MQKEEEQDGVGAMKSDVDDMRAAGIEAEDLAIGHVRKPGERVPVVGLPVNERPCDAPPGETREDDGVLINVIVIVIGDKLVMTRGPIDGQRGDDQKGAREERPPRAGYKNVHGEDFERDWPDAKIIS